MPNDEDSDSGNMQDINSLNQNTVSYFLTIDAAFYWD